MARSSFVGFAANMNLLARVLSLLVVAFWNTASHAAEAKPNWQTEWERTVQAAKKEGSLSLYMYQGDGELGAMAERVSHGARMPQDFHREGAPR